MQVIYGKNLIDVSHESAGTRIAREEAVVAADTLPGTVGSNNAEGVFVPGNTGDLQVLDRDFLRGRVASDIIPAGHGCATIPATSGRVLNILLEKGLDVKVNYALYVTDAGHLTNVAPAEGAKVFAYAKENVVTSDEPKLIAARIAQ